MERRFVNFLALAVAGAIVMLMASRMGGTTRGNCPENLKRGYQALQLYAVTNDERFPDGAEWMTRIAPLDPVPLKCPAVEEGFGYAFNDEYSAVRLPSGDSDLLIYDSAKVERNAHDPAPNVSGPKRHKDRCYGMSADGALKTLR